jgi:hypothetical protein
MGTTMEGHGTVQAPQCVWINQFSVKRPGSGTKNAAGTGSLLGPQSGGSARDSSRHADFRILIPPEGIGGGSAFQGVVGRRCPTLMFYILDVTS